MSSCKLATVLLLATLVASLADASTSAVFMQKSNNYQQQFNENENDDQNEDFSQLAESLAVSAAAAAGGQNLINSQCEPVKLGLCSSMPYNFTRTPNFFNDSSQAEAAEKAKHYELLVRTGCSRHLLAYLCELLAPMCIENDLQKKFEIYPCRPFCRKVKHDCQDQILDVAVRLGAGHVRQAFSCETFAFEKNGGNGHLQGPCHEMPDDGQQQQPSPPKHQNNANNYKPYQKDLDSNVPPFITDNSPIDQRIIRPSQPASDVKTRPTSSTTATATPTAGNPGVSTQLQSFGHQLAVGLLSYSNLLSVLTLICLLLVVNAKRIKRFKGYLIRRSSSTSSNRSSSSSSGSSSNSRRKFAAVPVLGQARKLALSPSSSSRSLVLVAADGKRANPKHKLLQAGELYTGSLEPSQKLLQAGLDRRTLINVNGTLERQKQQQNNAARYHLMQSIAANNNNEGPAKHQYDYIQVLNQARQQQQHQSCEFDQRPGYLNQQSAAYLSTGSSRQTSTNEPQLYSNILLSSPSHQVLLFGDNNPNEAHSTPNRPHCLTTAASLSSPYADPTIGAGLGGSIGSSRPAMHQMNGCDSASIQHQLMAVERQRSFQRRPSGSNSTSSRFQRAPNATAYVSSGASSGSSSAGSTTSSFSPPESSSGNLLLANQFAQSPRTGRGV